MDEIIADVRAYNSFSWSDYQRKYDTAMLKILNSLRYAFNGTVTVVKKCLTFMPNFYMKNDY